MYNQYSEMMKQNLKFVETHMVVKQSYLYTTMPMTHFSSSLSVVVWSSHISVIGSLKATISTDMVNIKYTNKIIGY